MDAKQGLKLLNVFLASFLAISLIGTVAPGMTGNFFQEEERPTCSFVTEDNVSQVPVDRCCVEASKMLSCRETNNGTVCGSGDQAYRLNHEAVNYCEKKGAELE